MKITVFGSGYVGLVVAACFAQVGNEVICMDVDFEKIRQLQLGKIPIYEPGLDQIVQATQASQHLTFTTNALRAIEHGECLFIAVGTPPDSEGKADLSYVLEVARTIGEHINRYTIIINKSTVPIGTADKVRATIQAQLNLRAKSIPFDVVSNPEFLKEGAALKDFYQPDRIVVGVDNSEVEKTLSTLYAPFIQNAPLIVMDTRSAELTKYAANAMLATKISFMNEMANLAEKVGADIEKVRIGMGADPRIGYHFTYPGCGFGGSCFGKDIQALIHTSQEYDNELAILRAVSKVNLKQKERLFEKIDAHFGGNLTNKVFALWGLAFKPETDDMRDAPSLMLLHALFEKGAKVQAYDPQAIKETQKIFGHKHPNLIFGSSKEEVLEGACALVILTEWAIFKDPDFLYIKDKIQKPVIFDGRNIYDPNLMEKLGILYYGIGRGKSVTKLL